MEALIIFTTLLCGLAINRVGFPPLIGYLAAGFIVYAFGVRLEQIPLLESFANIGVTLLLFTIGLKLDLKSLLKKEVWASATVHLVISMISALVLLKLLMMLGLSLLDGLTMNQLLLLTFALGFSSTVLAVKVLEEKGDMGSLYGQIAIGVLIMQDIFAVLFLTFSKGELPSIYAALLLLIPLARPLFYRLLTLAGHGELLVLFGLVMALVVGAALFDLVGLKADLGALLMGILLAKHAKANELAKSLFLFKELLLVCFFLLIGLNGLPGLAELELSLALLLLIPIKLVLFFALFVTFKLRARTALLSSLSLANFSEFGLIVLALCASTGWLEPQFILVLAISLALSFVIAVPLNQFAETLYERHQTRLMRYQNEELHEDDKPISTGDVKCIILGMGRIGAGAYDYMVEHYGDKVLGIEHKAELVASHTQLGRHVALGDASDNDFWDRLTHSSETELVLLAMPHHTGNLFALEQLKKSGFKGKISAVVRYQDEADILAEHGIHSTFNLYLAAGAGFAQAAHEAALQSSDPA